MEERSPFEGIDDPILRVQMEHEMRAIEELVFVTKLSFVPAHKDKAEGFRATLSCALCRWYDSCGKGQEQAVQLSRERATLLACLQELRKRLQDRHGFRCAEAVAKKAAADAVSAATVNPDAPNVLDAMVQLEQARTRAKAANKLALDAEKEKDAAEQRMLLSSCTSGCISSQGYPLVVLISVFWHSWPLCHEKVQLLVQGLCTGTRAWAWLCVTW